MAMTNNKVKATLKRKRIPTPALPEWKTRNLSDHLEKRARLDLSCLRQMLRLEESEKPLIGLYRKRSEEVYLNYVFVAEYEKLETDKSKKGFGEYRDLRVQFTDRELVLAITNDKRTVFITCFHYHFSEICQGYPQSESESGWQLAKMKEQIESGCVGERPIYRNYRELDS